MKILYLTALLCLALTSPAQAGMAEMHSLRQFSEAAKVRDYTKAEAQVTARSRELLARLWKHRAEGLIPTALNEAKDEQRGQFRYVWVHDGRERESGNLVLAFAEESGAPKLDLPETFRNGFGPKWEQTLNMIETAYLMAKTQFGDQTGQDVLHDMVKSYGAK